MTRILVRSVAALPAAAPVPALPPIEAAPAPPVSPVKVAVDALKTVREQLTDSRMLIRELVDLKDEALPLLRALGLNVDTPPAAPEGPMPEGPMGDGAPPPPPRVPADGKAAAAAPTVAPPPTEAQKALREEVRVLAGRLTRDGIVEAVMYYAPMVAEARKFRALADLIVAQSEQLGACLLGMPEDALRAAAVEMIMARGDADMPTIKRYLAAAVEGAADVAAEAKAQPAPAVAPVAEVPDDAPAAAKPAAKKSAKKAVKKRDRAEAEEKARGRGARAAKRKGGR